MPAGNNTKEKLLTRAGELISKEGLAAFSLRKLAAALNISAPSIYEHYRNKEEILTALRNQLTKRLADRLQKRVERQSAPEKQLLLLGEAYLDFAAEEEALFQLFFHQFESARTSLAEPPGDRSPYRILLDVFARFRPDLPVERLEEISLGYWSLFHGFAVLRSTFLSSFRMDWGPPRREILRTFIRGASRAD